MNATKRRLARESLIAAAKLGAMLSGCTCQPDVKLREPRPGVFIADVAHDGDCGHPSQRKGAAA